MGDNPTGRTTVAIGGGARSESETHWARAHGLNPDVVAVGHSDDLVLDFDQHRVYFTEIILDKADPDYDTGTRRRYVQLEAGPLPFPERSAATPWDRRRFSG